MTFQANGKLLLSGEYLVLDGALAFALPTVFGQKLKVIKSNNLNDSIIFWKSFDYNKSKWFDLKINLKQLNKNQFETPIIKLFNLISEIKPELFINCSYEMVTNLDFPKEWGLGTSSTLISLLSQWSEINPYLLLENSFGGSGYDIACAKSEKPILFKNKEYSQVDFFPNYQNKLAFVYLNKKMKSNEEIYKYNKLQKNQKIIDRISEISLNISQNNDDFKLFKDLILEHELIISNHLNVPTIKFSLFNDYKGEIKSLGAWGGDFVMITKSQDYKEYFVSKGYDTILEYDDLFNFKN